MDLNLLDYIWTLQFRVGGKQQIGTLDDNFIGPAGMVDQDFRFVSHLFDVRAEKQKEKPETRWEKVLGGARTPREERALPEGD